MKKILSMILVIAMLMVGAAFAEPAASELYESATGLFTMQIPADYIPMTGDFYEAIYNAADKEALAEYFDSEGVDGDALVGAIDDLDAMNFEGRDMILAPDLTANMNTTVAPSDGLTMELLAVLGDMLGEQLAQMYASMGVPAECCSTEGMMTFGSNEYFAFYVQMENMNMHQYMLITDAGDMITWTFTGIDAADEALMLETVAIK